MAASVASSHSITYLVLGFLPLASTTVPVQPPHAISGNSGTIVPDLMRMRVPAANSSLVFFFAMPLCTLDGTNVNQAPLAPVQSAPAPGIAAQEPEIV